MPISERATRPLTPPCDVTARPLPKERFVVLWMNQCLGIGGD
jgi:hypothetical protein